MKGIHIKSNVLLTITTMLLLFLPVLATSTDTAEQSITAFINSTKDNLTGGWAYTVEGAPEGYEKGLLLIIKEDDTYKVQVQVGNSTMIGENVSVKKNTISFNVFVEGDKVYVELTANGSTISGTSTSSSGVLKINGVKSLSAG